MGAARVVLDSPGAPTRPWVPWLVRATHSPRHAPLDACGPQVSAPPTQGGTITITGQNFGPIAPLVVQRVTIGTTECTNAVVTVDDTVVQCTAPPGVGRDINIEIVRTPPMTPPNISPQTMPGPRPAPSRGRR